MLISQLGNTLDSTVLRIRGELTIENAEELRTLLMKTTEGTDTLSLDLSEIDTIDVAGLQILCSAHRSWLGAQRKVVCTPGTIDTLAEAAVEAGFIRSSGCMPSAGGWCLFTGGSHV